MAVKFTQPEINIREKIAELDRPVGVAGSELLRADTVEQQQSMLGLGRKNIIINGNFDIWQRGDTVSGTGYYYSADRWQGYGYGTNTSTTTKEQFDYGEFPSEVPAEYYMRITSTQSHPYFRQPIENPRRYSGKKLTYSLWARSDTNVSLNPGLVIFHSGGYIYASELNRSTKRTDQWWDLTSEWKKYTVTFQMPDLSAYTFTAGNYFAIEHAATTGITGAIDIAQVQLELGEVATPFEYRTEGEELSLCQRYLVRLGAHPNDSTSDYNAIGTGWWRATTSVPYNVQIHITLPVTMRHDNYSVSVYGVNQFYLQSAGTTGQVSLHGVNNAGSSTNVCWIDMTATTAAPTDGQACVVCSENSPAYNNGILIDAEF